MLDRTENSTFTHESDLRGFRPTRSELSWTGIFGLLFVVIAMVGISTVLADYQPRPLGTLSFNHDIAPIIFAKCAQCHHAGQSAPFELITYRDVARRAQQILEVTQRNLMPPWLPTEGYGRFANERRLSVEEKGLIAQWVKEGAPEGNSKAPPTPQFPEGWFLGRPDLVVTMPQDYFLGAEGIDVYRNFVIPVPPGTNRFVRALEFSPGNPRIVHHAFFMVDEKRASRFRDAQDVETGFAGMNIPAQIPAGQFLSWQPGRLPVVSPEGLSWVLPGTADLVLQLHMNRSGKPEKIRSSIGLYFTNVPPTKVAIKATLTSFTLDIPAGDSNYVVTDQLTIPVDTQILSILPHAHYLAKEMQSYAILPDGTKKWLIMIKRWDFKWQGTYEYAERMILPKGSIVHLHFTYDNSTNNIYNSGPPLRRVIYGSQSSDEMCEVRLQTLAVNPEETSQLEEAFNNHLKSKFRVSAEHRLKLNPKDTEASIELAVFLAAEGKFEEAKTRLKQAAILAPQSDKPHIELGVILKTEQRLVEAKAEFETALRLDPKSAKTHGYLGFVFAELGDAANAERCFTRCLELDPADSEIQETLAELRQIRLQRLKGRGE